MNWTHNAFPIFLAVIFIAGGCERSRISKLEQQNGEFKAQLEKLKAANDYDMHEKCNRDGKEWLHGDQQQWDAKSTMFLTYNSHYNRVNNTCFIVVERHVKSIFGDDGSWSNVIELWDVLENNKYAAIQEDHLVHLKPQYTVGDDIVECEVAGNKCGSLVEFNNMTRPYMSN